MIRVTIEHVPDGDESRKRVLAREEVYSRPNPHEKRWTLVAWECLIQEICSLLPSEDKLPRDEGDESCCK